MTLLRAILMTMQTLIHADIFFFVTTIIEVIVAAVLIVVLVYIAVILADIRELSRTIKTEGAEIINDVHSYRQEIKEEAKYAMKNNSSTMAAFFALVASVFANRKSNNNKKQTHEE